MSVVKHHAAPGLSNADPLWWKETMIPDLWDIVFEYLTKCDRCSYGTTLNGGGTWWKEEGLRLYSGFCSVVCHRPKCSLTRWVSQVDAGRSMSISRNIGRQVSAAWPEIEWVEMDKQQRIKDGIWPVPD